jgi:hypothetical protein
VSIVVGTAPLPTEAEPPLQTEPAAPKITVTVPEAKFAPLEKPVEVSKIANAAASKAVQKQEAPSQSGHNETTAWNFLMSQGFTRNQTAGIMGNLQQEHGFQTSDVPGGLGIAQWMLGRRDNLMARANYLDINVQLQFLAEELGGLKGEIMAVDSVEHSALTFSAKFERCGDCRNTQRISYAYQILGRH